MENIYTVIRQLTINTEVRGVKAVMISNSSTTAAVQLWTYGLSGVSGGTASTIIQMAASSTDIYPIRIAGISFGSTITAWALS